MFLTDLELRALPQPDEWVFASPLIWDDPIFGRLVAPVGARTDLASIPRLVRNLPFLDPDGPSRRPAAMHDMLYRLGRSRGKDFADRFLRAALLSDGCAEATAAAFYWGVHLGGGPAWRSDGELTAESAFLTADDFQRWKAAGATI